MAVVCVLFVTIGSSRGGGCRESGGKEEGGGGSRGCSDGNLFLLSAVHSPGMP